MDDATERRGEPCVHRTHGEAAAVLAALGLVNRAYALLWRGLADAPEERQASATAYVEQSLGVNGLLNGQSEDLHYGGWTDGRRSPQQRVLRIRNDRPLNLLVKMRVWYFRLFQYKAGLAG